MIMAELYTIGEKVEIGTRTFTEDAIIRFASRYDPQVFHMDVEAARHSLFGGLCASGWHTCAVWMQTFIDYWARESARLTEEGLTPPKIGPSAGFRNLQWLRPVFAGDAVTYSVTFLGGRPLNSRPGHRLNQILCEGSNQDGAPVLRFESAVLEFE